MNPFLSKLLLVLVFITVVETLTRRPGWPQTYRALPASLCLWSAEIKGIHLLTWHMFTLHFMANRDSNKPSLFFKRENELRGKEYFAQSFQFLQEVEGLEPELSLREVCAPREATVVREPDKHLLPPVPMIPSPGAQGSQFSMSLRDCSAFEGGGGPMCMQSEYT